MQCHNLVEKLDLPAGKPRVVLVGNPNVGKSVFFHNLTGIYVDVSNYPGTTLEIAHGEWGPYVIMDTPGIYGVSSFNDEEIVARDVVLSADLVLNVVDAVHLERDLFLTQQIIDMGLPVVVALNMVDEAEKHGLAIDIDMLSDMLGVPVVPTVAVTGQGLGLLKERLNMARPGTALAGLEHRLTSLGGEITNRAEALLILEGDEEVSRRHGQLPGEEQADLYLQRRQRVNTIVGHVVQETNNNAAWATKLGRLMVRPSTGIPILLLVLFGMYEIIGILVAQDLIAVTEEALMQGYYEPWIKNLVGSVIPPASWLGTLLIGEFGLLTMTVTYILGLLLPLVFSFYLVLSIFEDSGYLPRIATLVDRFLTYIGLNGRGVIPIILGFGCVTMATITTRLLGSDRERRIATFLLAMAIPCSAQLAVIAGLVAGLGPAYAAMYGLTIFFILVISGTILHRMLPGESTGLLLDLPPLRFPNWRNVFKKTFVKSTGFLREASPLFAGGAFFLGVLQVTGVLRILQEALAPLTVTWLQLPKEAANAFIMGFVRRDFGAAGLYDLTLTPAQILVAAVTITLFVPCIASAMVIIKERGPREAAIVWPSIFGLAFLIGGIMSQLII